MKTRFLLPESVRRAVRALRPFLLSLDLPRNDAFVQPDDEQRACSEFSIVVAVHDAPLVTQRCLASLALYAKPAEIILVDDGSREKITRELLQFYSNRHGWKLIVNKHARGHSRACEIGAALATRPYLCLLNSDTFVTPWGWKAIGDAFVASPRLAVIGPSTSWATTPQRIVKAMHCRHYWTDSQIVGFARRYLDALPEPVQVELPEISGFAFFIRRDIWFAFGGFHDEIHDYGNESELCGRLRADGWQLAWVKSSYIHHFGEQSYSQLGVEYIARRKQEIRNFLAGGRDAYNREAS